MKRGERVAVVEISQANSERKISGTTTGLLPPVQYDSPRAAFVGCSFVQRLRALETGGYLTGSESVLLPQNLQTTFLAVWKNIGCKPFPQRE